MSTCSGHTFRGHGYWAFEPLNSAISAHPITLYSSALLTPIVAHPRHTLHISHPAPTPSHSLLRLLITLVKCGFEGPDLYLISSAPHFSHLPFSSPSSATHLIPVPDPSCSVNILLQRLNHFLPRVSARDHSRAIDVEWLALFRVLYQRCT